MPVSSRLATFLRRGVRHIPWEGLSYEGLPGFAAGAAGGDSQ
jgi:hypothetical protein